MYNKAIYRGYNATYNLQGPTLQHKKQTNILYRSMEIVYIYHWVNPTPFNSGKWRLVLAPS